MKQVTGLLATYSSDEFGICSALYELGGMVVMHDASGCNSTYTTHDEPRWYEQESMIYISALSEMEAIMGDDDKLIRDITETAQELAPAFIAIVGAPIPYMIGTDFPAVAAVVEKNTGIPCFGFPANGMNGYLTGVSMALEAVARRFCTETGNSREGGSKQTLQDEKTKQVGQTGATGLTGKAGLVGKTVQPGGFIDLEQFGNDVSTNKRVSRVAVNILGATPLDFSLNGSVDSMKDWLRENGFTPLACLAMGSSLEEISHAEEAQVNLVVSYGGLAAAKLLRSRFGTPYVTGVPLGDSYAEKLAALIARAAKTGECLHGIFSGAQNKVKSAGGRVIIGESIYSVSLAEAIELETGLHMQVLCPLETEDALLREGDLVTPEEDDILTQAGQAKAVVADPLYRTVIPAAAKFYPLPHEAFSGRIYDEENPNLVNKRLCR